MVVQHHATIHHHRDARKLYNSKSFITTSTAWFLMLLLFAFADSTFSQSLIETLPGFLGKLPFTLETGYIGVGKSNDVQLFYYFIESERDPDNDPLVLWLTGGPGCSGLSALLYEIGPFTFDYMNFIGDVPALELNPYSWTKVANIIFIDQPAGSGYSYAHNHEASKCNDTLSAEQTYEFLLKWVIDHPRFLHNPLYVAGDSYTGIIVPVVVHKIYEGNRVGHRPFLNMKGYIQGNPVTDKYNDPNGKVPYAHRMGLLSDDLYQLTEANCDGKYMDADHVNTLCAADLQRVNKCLDRIRHSHILEPWCSVVTGRWDVISLAESTRNTKSLLPPPNAWCRTDNYAFSHIWANDKTVQEALQVRKGTVAEWVRCNESMFYQSGLISTGTYVFDVQSTVEHHKSFANESCLALVYSGDHDMLVPHTSTENWIKSLKLPVESEWTPWFVDGQIAGYTIKYSIRDYNLVYATIKGAGHTAPEYKPRQCLEMIERWFAGYPL